MMDDASDRRLVHAFRAPVSSLCRPLIHLLLFCCLLSCETSVQGSLVVCSAAQLMCGGACVDPVTSNSHCGNCYSACGAGTTCSGGACVAADGTSPPALMTTVGSCAPEQPNCVGSCPAGETKCGLSCVDLAQDEANCGACGAPCAATQVCNSGICECEFAATLCGDSCVHLRSDVSNCGGCGLQCQTGQICEQGSCQCPAGELPCAERCRNPLNAAEHCGACGNACTGGKACEAGLCSCPTGQTVCSDVCSDVQTDALNCGACGIACPSGQVCRAAACACPEGQTLCGGACVDTQTDERNCGACGASCGLGEGCAGSVCAGGGIGDDGCSGVAQTIEIDKINLYQTIELPLVRDGAEVPQRSVAVVAGRKTLVRVFVKVGPDWTARKLSARLFLASGEKTSVLYTKAPQTVSGASFDEAKGNSYSAARASTFEFMVDGLDASKPDNVVFTDSTQYAVEIVECGAAPNAPALRPRFPAAGAAALRAVDVGPMRIRFVPLRSNGIAPATTDDALAPFLAGLRATYPTATIEHSVREAANVDDARDWVTNLDQLRALRARDNADSDIYYYGLLRPANTITEFCGRGCVAGIGYTPAGIGRGYAEQRAALGLAFAETGVETMLHELGHNLGRAHAPCTQGGQIQGVDANFPHEGAKVGIRGYNLLADELVSENRPDIMGYCEAPWFSDYTYKGMLDRIRAVNSANQSFIPDPVRQGDFRVLLLEAGKPAKWGVPVMDGVATGTAERALILDSSGTIVDNVEVYRTAISDVEAFSIEVPAPKPGWYAVQLHDQFAVAF